MEVSQECGENLFEGDVMWLNWVMISLNLLWDLGEMLLQMPFDNLKHVKQGGLFT
jgi:hypothetical protein